MSPSIFIPAKEAAATYGITERTFRALAQRLRFREFKIGLSKKLYVRTEVLERKDEALATLDPAKAGVKRAGR